MSAPSWERITSSTASRSSIPGAILAIAARSSALRRGSSSDGMRMKPRSPTRSPLRSVVSFGSIAIQPRLDRLPQGLCGLDLDFAIGSGARRRENEGETELRALLEPPLGLRGRAQAAGESDLAECRNSRLHRNAARCGSDSQSNREVSARLVDANAAGDVDEDIRLSQRDARVPGEHRDDHREPLRIDAGRNAAW